MPAMDGSRCAYERAVTAPMERPHRPMLEVVPPERRCCTAASRSSTSCAPSVTQPPSDSPDPCRTNRRFECGTAFQEQCTQPQHTWYAPSADAHLT